MAGGPFWQACVAPAPAYDSGGHRLENVCRVPFAKRARNDGHSASRHEYGALLWASLPFAPVHLLALCPPPFVPSYQIRGLIRLWLPLPMHVHEAVRHPLQCHADFAWPPWPVLRPCRHPALALFPRGLQRPYDPLDDLIRHPAARHPEPCGASPFLNTPTTHPVTPPDRWRPPVTAWVHARAAPRRPAWSCTMRTSGRARSTFTTGTARTRTRTTRPSARTCPPPTSVRPMRCG